MNEDDTFDCLRRISIREMDAKLDYWGKQIYWNERARRFNEKISKKRKTAYGRFFTGKVGYLSIDDYNTWAGLKDMFHGTGWTLESYVAEVHKQIDAEKQEENMKIKTRLASIFLTMAVCSLIVVVMSTFGAPVWAMIVFPVMLEISLLLRCG